jgi:hypothetical protein
MPIVRSTLWLLIVVLLALPLACGSDEGPPPPPPGGGQLENGDAPAPTLVCPAYFATTILASRSKS